MPPHPPPADACGCRRQGSRVIERAQSFAGRLDEGLAHHPLRTPLIGAQLDVEAHLPAPDGRASNPGARVRDAEVGGCAIEAIRSGREPGLSAALEHELTRTHGTTLELRKRLQRECHPCETCTPRVPIGPGDQAARVRQPSGEGARRSLRPLITQVGVI